MHFLREDQALRSMRGTSFGYKHGICILRGGFSGLGLITGCPCAPSRASCLGLLTVEKRMLWLECCGVNGSDCSSTLLLSDSCCSSASHTDKVACARHMVACNMHSHHVIKLSFHPCPTLPPQNIKLKKQGNINARGSHLQVLSGSGYHWRGSL